MASPTFVQSLFLQKKTCLRIDLTPRKQNRLMKGEKKQALITCLNPDLTHA